jgi:hypothetical protein
VGDHCSNGALDAGDLPVLGAVTTTLAAISTTCPQAIAAANHKRQTAEWWADPLYQTIAALAIKDKICAYCGIRPATLAHHDEDWMYLTKEAYYDPHNMTPCCWPCHENYRRGRVICPVCRKHYIRRTSEKCRWCRGLAIVSRKGKAYFRKPEKYRRHPCRFHESYQGCQLHRICTHSWRRARACGEFEERKKEVS